MPSNHRKIIAIGVSLLVFSLTHVPVGARQVSPPADTDPRATTPAQEHPLIAGMLQLKGNKPALVDGIPSETGETIFSGQTLEVPKGVVAGVALEPQGDVLLVPETKATLTFGRGSIEVRLIQGGVHLVARKGTTGVVSTDRGRVGVTDPREESSLDVYLPPGAGVAVLDRGQVMKAAAGVWNPDCAECPNCGTCWKVFGVCWYQIVPVIIGGGIATGIIIGRGGTNPSPMSPND